MPTRTSSVRNVEDIQERTKEIFEVRPKAAKVWTATRHKDLTRKARDFLWKGTQNAYKIGNH